MAKNTFPMKTGSGLLAKTISTLLVVAALVLVVKHPADAAAFVTDLVHIAGQTVDGLSTFIGQITK